MGVLFVTRVVLLVTILFLLILNSGFTFLRLVAFMELLNVLILFLELLFDFNVDELRVIYADGSGLRFLAHHLIYEVHGLLGQFDELQGLFIVHFRVNQ